MSWRSLFALLIVAVAASAWGGLRLGNWLVAHGPALAKPLPDRIEASSVPLLDANGKAVVAQPPQPLVSGGLGVPQTPAEVAWEIPAKSLDETKANQVVAVSTTPITMVEAQQIAKNNDTRNLVGIGDVGNLMGSQGNSAKQPIQPIDAPEPPPPPNPSAPPESAAWQASLRQDLQACSAESFFDRPSCAWAARNKYCTPHQAWGTIKDCPAKSF